MADETVKTPTLLGRLIAVMTQGDGTGLAGDLQKAQQGFSEGLQQLAEFKAGFAGAGAFAQGLHVPDVSATGINAVSPLNTPNLVGPSQGFSMFKT